jgi:hypothetical protein
MATDLCLDLGPPAVSFFPESPLSTKLSTILESDLSRLSSTSLHWTRLKYPTFLERSLNQTRGALPFARDQRTRSPGCISARLVVHVSVEKGGHAYSIPSTNEWRAGVVVEGAADNRPTSRSDRKELVFDIGEEPLESLHLDALDIYVHPNVSATTLYRSYANYCSPITPFAP